jgi:hypothetical protein
LDTIVICKNCGNDRRVETYAWSEDTCAKWEPCELCCKDEYKRFYKAKEEARRFWYPDVIKPKPRRKRKKKKKIGNTIIEEL